MVEIAVLIGPCGVKKTKIIAPRGDHARGFELYERILPFVEKIDESLCLDSPCAPNESL